MHVQCVCVVDPFHTPNYRYVFACSLSLSNSDKVCHEHVDTMPESTYP